MKKVKRSTKWAMLFYEYERLVQAASELHEFYDNMSVGNMLEWNAQFPTNKPLEDVYEAGGEKIKTVIDRTSNLGEELEKALNNETD